MNTKIDDEVRLRALQVAARVKAEMEARFRSGGVVWTAEDGGPPRLAARSPAGGSARASIRHT
ncbi:MAG: hypothetical protein JO306_09495 [Gemmatimonadetes bacterium]|nr:hypothetical protein [Gemmatimonadota bacterium]